MSVSDVSFVVVHLLHLSYKKKPKLVKSNEGM